MSDLLGVSGIRRKGDRTRLRSKLIEFAEKRVKKAQVIDLIERAIDEDEEAINKLEVDKYY